VFGKQGWKTLRVFGYNDDPMMTSEMELRLYYAQSKADLGFTNALLYQLSYFGLNLFTGYKISF